MDASTVRKKKKSTKEVKKKKKKGVRGKGRLADARVSQIEPKSTLVRHRKRKRKISGRKGKKQEKKGREQNGGGVTEDITYQGEFCFTLRKTEEGERRGRGEEEGIWSPPSHPASS